MHTQSYSIQFEAVLHPLAGSVLKGDALTRKVGGYVVATTANLALSSTGRVDCVALMDGLGGAAIKAAFDGQLFPETTGLASSVTTGFADVDATGRLVASAAQGPTTIGTRGKDGSVTLAIGVGAIVSNGTGIGDWDGPTEANLVRRITGSGGSVAVSAAGFDFDERAFSQNGHYLYVYDRTTDIRPNDGNAYGQTAMPGAATYTRGGGYNLFAGAGATADLHGSVRLFGGGPYALGGGPRLSVVFAPDQATVGTPLQAPKFIIGPVTGITDKSFGSDPASNDPQFAFTYAATYPTITSGAGVPTAAENAGSVYFRTNGTAYTTTGGGVWATIAGSAFVTGGDVTGPSGALVVVKVNGVDIPTGAGNAVGNVLRVTVAGAGGDAAWGALDLADADAVTGALPEANQADQTLAGAVTGPTGSNAINLTGNASITGSLPESKQDDQTLGGVLSGPTSAAAYASGNFGALNITTTGTLAGASLDRSTSGALTIGGANATSIPLVVAGATVATCDDAGIAIGSAAPSFGGGTNVISIQDGTAPSSGITAGCALYSDTKRPSFRYTSDASAQNVLTFAGIPLSAAVTLDTGRVLKLVLKDDGGNDVTKYVRLWDIS